MIEKTEKSEKEVISMFIVFFTNETLKYIFKQLFSRFIHKCFFFKGDMCACMLHCFTRVRRQLLNFLKRMIKKSPVHFYIFLGNTK